MVQNKTTVESVKKAKKQRRKESVEGEVEGKSRDLKVL